MSKGICGAVAVFAVMLVGASSATAATQIGQTFTPLASTDAGVDMFQVESPGGQYTVPFPGVITAWSFQGAGTRPQGLKFKVARPAGGANYTIVGQSPPKNPPAGLSTYTDVQIPVQVGDVIGFHNGTVNAQVASFAGAGYAERERTGDLQPGSTESFAGPFSVQLNVSARLEPDADCDGFGDETQDPSVDPTGCNPLVDPQKTNRSVSLDANKNKVKKGKNVTLSGRLSPATRQGPCESGQTVELQRKRPKQTTFATFAQVQTDAQGSFSLKKKIKKTFEFRAQVVETAACSAALSNSEKVKVKKKAAQEA